MRGLRGQTHTRLVRDSAVLDPRPHSCKYFHFTFQDVHFLTGFSLPMILAILLLPAAATALCSDTDSCISRVREIVAAPRK